MWLKDYKNNPVESRWEGDILIINISASSNIRIYLAKIKKKNDGRWEYYIIPSKCFYEQYNKYLPEKKQGVFPTRELCIEYIENIYQSAAHLKP